MISVVAFAGPFQLPPKTFRWDPRPGRSGRTGAPGHLKYHRAGGCFKVNAGVSIHAPRAGRDGTRDNKRHGRQHGRPKSLHTIELGLSCGGNCIQRATCWTMRLTWAFAPWADGFRAACKSTAQPANAPGTTLRLTAEGSRVYVFAARHRLALKERRACSVEPVLAQGVLRSGDSKRRIVPGDVPLTRLTVCPKFRLVLCALPAANPLARPAIMTCSLRAAIVTKRPRRPHPLEPAYRQQICIGSSFDKSDHSVMKDLIVQ